MTTTQHRRILQIVGKLSHLSDGKRRKNLIIRATGAWPIIEDGKRALVRLLADDALALFSKSCLDSFTRTTEPDYPCLSQIRADASGPADRPTAISLDRFEARMLYLHEHG